MRLFLLGATPSFVSAPEDDSASKLAKTGGNTGNQLIAHGLLKRLSYQHVEWDYTVGPAAVRERCDMLVIAAANFLFPAFDFGGMAGFIESTQLPLAIVGLGAQAPSYDPDIELQPGTERFVKVVAERAPVIGVRGPFTAEVLARRGVHNVQVTGCPSYYLHGQASLTIAKKSFDEVKRISVNGSRDVIRHSFAPDLMRQVVQGIYREGIVSEADFIAQSEPEEILIADGADATARAAATDRLLRALGELRTAAGEPLQESTVRGWAHDHLRVYFDVEDWIRDIKTYDFVFGHRLHGNMIALQHGVPACLICHDTRTEEIARFLGLPHVSQEQAGRVDARELYEATDVETLASRYAELAPAYRDFLSANGLTPA